MSTKEYESTFVLDPTMDEAQVDQELTKIREFLGDRSVEITEIQKWGRRKLAYEIRKKKEGVYTLIRFKGGPEVPPELDRRYRLNENMLRYLTVLYEAPPAGELGTEHGEGEAGQRREPGEVPRRTEEAPRKPEAPAASASTAAPVTAVAEPVPEAAPESTPAATPAAPTEDPAPAGEAKTEE